MKYKISVIVPIYNVEKYIERCARSLFEQTLDSIEYIFVNDCTPDNSIGLLNSVIEQYPERRNDIVIYNMKENKGLPSVRKFGVKHAHGEYVIHCDSDDWVEIDMYEKLYNKAVFENLDIVICDFYTAMSEEQREHVIQRVPTDKQHLMVEILNESVHSATWNKLVKASLYKNKIMYPKDNLREDLSLFVQLLYYASSIGYINEPLYNYFFNQNSITNRNDNFDSYKSKANQAINNYSLLDSFFKRNQTFVQFESELQKMRYRIKYTFLRMNCYKGGYKIWKEIFPDLSILGVLSVNLAFTSKIAFILASFRLYSIFKK